MDDGVVDDIAWLVSGTLAVVKGEKIDVVRGERGVLRRGRTSLISHSGSLTRAEIS